MWKRMEGLQSYVWKKTVEVAKWILKGMEIHNCRSDNGDVTKINQKPVIWEVPKSQWG